jgi:Xaa-Pro aminopeptidase
MKNRLKRLQGKLSKENLDFLLVTVLPHVRYLSGYSGSNGMILLAPKSSVFLTDFRYKEQAKEQVRNMKAVTVERDLFSGLSDLAVLKGKRIKLGFETNHLSCQVYRRLKSLLPNCLLVPTEGIVGDSGFHQTGGEGAGCCCGTGIQNEKVWFVGALF